METALAPGALRMQEILGRIRPAVSAKGFEGSSMQDLSHAAGMSAGNFYRYFPSKAAIIEALVQRDMENAERSFARIRRSSEPRKVMREVVIEQASQIDCATGCLWAEIEATAARRPQIALLLQRMQGQVLSNIVEVLARLAGVPIPEAAKRYHNHARLIMMLVHGLWKETARSSANAERHDDVELANLVNDSIDMLIDDMLATRPAAMPTRPSAMPIRKTQHHA